MDVQVPEVPSLPATLDGIAASESLANINSFKEILANMSRYAPRLEAKSAETLIGELRLLLHATPQRIFLHSLWTKPTIS